MRVSNLGSLCLYSSLIDRSNLRHCISVFIILLLLGGCSYHVTPDTSNFELGSIPEFSTPNAISIVNSQSSANDVMFYTSGGHKWYGNYQRWTDTAIEITRRKLSERGMNVVNDAHKSLKLSIDTVKITNGIWVMRCEITLKVETNEGYVKTYLGDKRSPNNIHKAVTGAVMYAVAEMLRDENIISYLKA